jgi:hypothetical protein
MNFPTDLTAMIGTLLKLICFESSNGFTELWPGLGVRVGHLGSLIYLVTVLNLCPSFLNEFGWDIPME